MPTLLALPSLGWCRHVGPSAGLVRVSDGRRCMASKFVCRSWRCPACATFKLHRVGQWIGLKLLDADPEMVIVEEEYHSLKHWKKLKRMLQRYKAEWVRIGPAAGRGVVIAVYRGEFEKAISDRLEAVRRLGQALNRLAAAFPLAGAWGQRVRPLDCSRGWKQPERAKEWVRTAWVPADDLGLIFTVLPEFGITDGRKSKDGIGVLFTLPDGVHDEDIWKRLAEVRAAVGRRL